MADGGSDTVVSSIAAADDDDMLILGGNEVAVLQLEFNRLFVVDFKESTAK